MSNESALERGREAAASRMTDRCRVGTWRRNAQPDAATGEFGFALVDIVYEGPCTYKPGSNEERAVDAAGQSVVIQKSIIKFPVPSSGLITTDHSAIILSSDSDPALAGKRFRITAPFFAAGSTTRRFPVEGTS